MNREAIVSALFTKASASAGFVTKGRRFKLWTEVPASAKPALFLMERGEDYVRDSEAVPAKVTLNVDLFIYTSVGKDPNTIPGQQLNQLLDAIDAALAPEPVTGKQTLGGLVSHCWIEGNVMKDTGDMDGDGLAVIPVKILVPT